MDALHALKTRRSVRSYKPDPVPPAVVDDLVDCGRLAASGRNVQPWEFVVVTAATTRQRLGELIENGRHIAVAPVCIAVFCTNTTYYLEDGSAALQNILVAARAHGLGGCWVAGDKKPYAPQVAQLLGAPAGCKLIGLAALGYATEEPGLPPKRPLSEVLHRETF